MENSTVVITPDEMAELLALRAEKAKRADEDKRRNLLRRDADIRVAKRVFGLDIPQVGEGLYPHAYQKDGSTEINSVRIAPRTWVPKAMILLLAGVLEASGKNSADLSATEEAAVSMARDIVAVFGAAKSGKVKPVVGQPVADRNTGEPRKGPGRPIGEITAAKREQVLQLAGKYKTVIKPRK